MITYPYVPTLLFEVLRGFQLIVFMSGGITFDGHISKLGITELKVGSSENWYSRVR